MQRYQLLKAGKAPGGLVVCWMLMKNVYKGGFFRQSLKGKTNMDIKRL